MYNLQGTFFLFLFLRNTGEVLRIRKLVGKKIGEIDAEIQVKFEVHWLYEKVWLQPIRSGVILNVCYNISSTTHLVLYF